MSDGQNSLRFSICDSCVCLDHHLSGSEVSPLDQFDHLSVFSILDSCNLLLCVNAAPAKAALGTCHGNIMSGINVVLRYMTRDLILHHSSGRRERRHTCVRMDSTVTSNELHSCYSHFLFSKTRPDDKKMNEMCQEDHYSYTASCFDDLYESQANGNRILDRIPPCVYRKCWVGGKQVSECLQG